MINVDNYPGNVDSCVEIFLKSVYESDFLADNMLLSRLLLIKVDELNYMLLSAVHHSIWDGMSQELLLIMLNETLDNNCGELSNYSYTTYCNAVEVEDNNYTADSYEAEDLSRYSELAYTASMLNTHKEPAYRMDVHAKLNDSQKFKFEDSPIDTAMSLLTDLMYGESYARLSAVPFAVLSHNRNELNSGMLGLTLSIDLALFDTEMKRQTKTSFGHLSDPDRLSGAKIMDRTLHIDDKDLSNGCIPVLNYLGIFHASDNADDSLPETPNIECVCMESGSNDAYMEFYVQNNVFNASILGMKFDNDAIEAALRKI